MREETMEAAISIYTYNWIVVYVKLCAVCPHPLPYFYPTDPHTRTSPKNSNLYGAFYLSGIWQKGQRADDKKKQEQQPN